MALRGAPDCDLVAAHLPDTLITSVVRDLRRMRKASFSRCGRSRSRRFSAGADGFTWAIAWRWWDRYGQRRGSNCPSRKSLAPAPRTFVDYYHRNRVHLALEKQAKALTMPANYRGRLDDENAGFAVVPDRTEPVQRKRSVGVSLGRLRER